MRTTRPPECSPHHTSAAAPNVLIPEVRSSLFADRPAARFAVGIVAIRDQIRPGLNDEYFGYGLLRGNVYAHECAFLTPGALNDDGTETDEFDQHSVHFIVAERAAGDNRARIVASIRLIIKGTGATRTLPVEELCPRAFADRPAPERAAEVSRLICRHEDPLLQRRLLRPMFTAALLYGIVHGYGPGLGLVEAPLLRTLTREGVPAVPLDDAHFVAAFNSENLPISIDVADMRTRIDADSPGALEKMRQLTHEFVYMDGL